MSDRAAVGPPRHRDGSTPATGHPDWKACLDSRQPARSDKPAGGAGRWVADQSGWRNVRLPSDDHGPCFRRPSCFLCPTLRSPSILPGRGGLDARRGAALLALTSPAHDSPAAASQPEIHPRPPARSWGTPRGRRLLAGGPAPSPGRSHAGDQRCRVAVGVGDFPAVGRGVKPEPIATRPIQFSERPCTRSWVRHQRAALGRQTSKVSQSSRLGTATPYPDSSAPATWSMTSIGAAR